MKLRHMYADAIKVKDATAAKSAYTSLIDAEMAQYGLTRNDATRIVKVTVALYIETLDYPHNMQISNLYKSL